MRKALPVFVISLVLAAVSWPWLKAYAQQIGTPSPDGIAVSLDELHVRRRYGEVPPMSSAAPTASQPPSAPLTADLLDWNRAVAMTWNYPTFDLVRFDKDHPFGSPWRLTYNTTNETDPRLNHAANRLVYNRKVGNLWRISAMTIDGFNQVDLTGGESDSLGAAWSPDDTRLVFYSKRDGPWDIYVMNADGSNSVRLTVDQPDDFAPVWSPDGNWLAWFKAPANGTTGALWLMRPDGTQAHLIAGNLRYPQNLLWSPDSTQLAFDYDADQDGWNEMAVINADGSQLTTIYDASNYSGAMQETWPSDWSTDGYIYYTQANFSPYCSSSGCWYQLNTSAVFRLQPDGSGNEGVAADDWHYYLSFDIEPLDRNLPSSSMSPLSAISPYSITLQWSGQDSGPSGLNDFDVEYKDGSGGAWTDLLLYETTITNTVFWGQGGHTYYFRVRARDNAFNLEAWPATYDAVTTIESAPPVTTLDQLPRFARSPLTVSWHGVDPGNSGINVYYLQFQDLASPGWIDWVATSNSTATFIDGLPGHTYEFRVRGHDLANNAENWPTSTSPVTIYAWGVAGNVADHSGRPVVGLAASLTPDSVGVADNARLPIYGAYALQAGAYQFNGQRAGYAPLPTTPLAYDPARDTRLDLYLPPLDNAIDNGDFEAANSPIGWQTSGALATSLDVKYTGQRSLKFGADRPGDPVETLFNGQVAALAVDADQTVHLLTLVDLGAGYNSVRYAIRPVTGTWPLAPTRIITTSGVVSILRAVPDDAGGLHVAGVWGNSTRSNVYYCHVTPAFNGCVLPTAQTAFTNLQIGSLAVQSDRAGGVHLAWAAGGAMYYRYLPASGSWGPIETVAADNSGAAPYIGIDDAGRRHLVWSRSEGIWSQVAYYTQRLDNGQWLTPTALLTAWEPAAAAWSPDGTLHLLWVSTGSLYHSVKPLDQAVVSTLLDSTPWQFTPIAMRANAGGTLHALLRRDTFFTEWVREPDGSSRNLTVPFSGAIGLAQIDSHAVLHMIGFDGNLQRLVYEHTAYLPADTVHDLGQTVSLSPTLHRPSLSFLYRSDWGTAANRLTVQLDNGLTVTTVYSGDIASAHWQHAAIDVSGWAGQTITLAFQIQQARGTPYVGAYLDDVALGSALTPAVTAISVHRVETTAGVPITITGDNFLATPAVSIGSTPLLNVQWLDEHTLTATLPALPPGWQGPVWVVNPGGQTAVLDDAIEVGRLVFLPLLARNAYH